MNKTFINEQEKEIVLEVLTAFMHIIFKEIVNSTYVKSFKNEGKVELIVDLVTTVLILFNKEIILCIVPCDFEKEEEEVGKMISVLFD